jgi:hypothetical protein
VFRSGTSAHADVFEFCLATKCDDVVSKEAWADEAVANIASERASTLIDVMIMHQLLY